MNSNADNSENANGSVRAATVWLVAILLVLVGVLISRLIDQFAWRLHDPNAVPRAVTARGDLAEDGEAGPYVLAPLVIVRRGRDHAERAPGRAGPPSRRAGSRFDRRFSTSQADTLRLLLLAGTGEQSAQFAQHAATAIEHALLYARLRAQTDELNRMAAVQTDFLRGVTHDLQTPLTRIGALASELRPRRSILVALWDATVRSPGLRWGA